MHYFQQILNDLNVRYTVPYARTLFESRSDSGSLYGIKKMLEKFGLTICAIQAESADDIEYPCICKYHGTVQVLKSKPDDYEELAGKVVLILEGRGRGKEPGYISNVIRLVLQVVMPYLTGAAVLVLVLISFLSDSSFDLHKLILLILNGIGIFFSWRTVAKECSGTCKEVTESTASKLFGLYSLGVIGLSYFISSLLIVLFIPALSPILALISCAALIMPLWSLSYQAFIVRAWCKNCIGVQAAVIAIFITELIFCRISISSLEWMPALAAVSIYISTFFFADRFYSAVQKNKQYPMHLLTIYQKIMRDVSVREKIISAGWYYDTADSSTVLIHKAEGENAEVGNAKELLFVISPFCEHCRELFLKLYEMIESEQLKDYNITLLFAPGKSSLPVYGSVICEYQQHGTKSALDLLYSWFNSFKINRFRKKFSACALTLEYNAEIARQKTWYEKSKIHGTPVMIINSHRVSYLLLDEIAANESK